MSQFNMFFNVNKVNITYLFFVCFCKEHKQKGQKNVFKTTWTPSCVIPGVLDDLDKVFYAKSFL